MGFEVSLLASSLPYEDACLGFIASSASNQIGSVTNGSRTSMRFPVLGNRASVRRKCNPHSAQYWRKESVPKESFIFLSKHGTVVGKSHRTREAACCTDTCCNFDNRSWSSKASIHGEYWDRIFSRLAVGNVHATWSANDFRAREFSGTKGNLGTTYDLRTSVHNTADGKMHVDAPNAVNDCEPGQTRTGRNYLAEEPQNEEDKRDYGLTKSSSNMETATEGKSTEEATMDCNRSNGGDCELDGTASCSREMGIAKNAVLPLGNVRRFLLENPDFLGSLQDGCLSPNELQNSQMLKKFKYTHCSSKGMLMVIPLRVEQFRETKELLADSFAELMWGPFTYRPLLAWIVGQYLRERQNFFPHALTLVGLYAPAEENALAGNIVDSSMRNWVLAGTAEISLNGKGQPASPPTPLPPKDAPFLCNMAVQKKYRRRGIGWQILKAAEELLWQVGCKEIYLHCRMIDEAPLSMYRKAGYKIITTDSILSLLTFQRRRFLMRKKIGSV